MLKACTLNLSKSAILAIGVLASVFALAAPVSSQVLFSWHADVAPEIAFTRLPSQSLGLQPGVELNAGAFLTGNSAMLKSYSPYAWKPSDLRPAWKLAADASYQRVGQSAVLADWSSYRAWQTFSAGLRGGIQFPLKLSGNTPQLAFFGFLAGGAVHVSNYIYTGLVSAYPSIAGELFANFPLSSSLALRIILPAEIAFRGGGTSTFLGLGAGIEFLPKRNAASNGGQE